MDHRALTVALLIVKIQATMDPAFCTCKHARVPLMHKSEGEPMLNRVSLAIAACLALASCVETSGTGGAVGGLSGSSSSAPRGYERLQSPATHAFRFAAPGEPVRRGNRSERFELRSGDCGGSDCGQPRYRSEVRELPASSKARVGADIWYGWSFLNQNVATLPASQSLGLVFGQWKTSGEQPAAFRLIQSGGNVVAQLDDMRTNGGLRSAEVCTLFNLDQNRGKWVDLVVNTNFAADSTGYLRIWVNGEARCNYSGRLIADPAIRPGSAGPTTRRGIFASSTLRWDRTKGAEPKPTMVVFYDEFLVGKTRIDVDTRLRETGGAKPKD
jgi:hypothetical protein